MTKTIEQIQKENRKLILQAIHGCSYDEALKIEGQKIKPLTLSRLLLAFKNKEVKTCYEDEIIFNIAGSQFCGLKLEDEFHNSHYSLYGVCLWNLELETLEEQTEETQRKINELFTN